MSQNFTGAHYDVGGFPEASEFLELGPVGGTKTRFTFVTGADPAENHVRTDDISTVSALCERTANVINGSDSGWFAEAGSSRIDLTPPAGDPGSQTVTSSASGFSVGYDGPAPTGVILSG